MRRTGRGCSTAAPSQMGVQTLRHAVCTAAFLLLSACSTSQPSHVSRPVVATVLGTVDFDAEPSLTIELLSERLIAHSIRPVTLLEYSTGAGTHITVINLGDYQDFCDHQPTPTPLYLVFIDNRLAGTIRRRPRIYDLPRAQMTHDFVNGELRRVRRDATRADTPADLPFLDGLPSLVDISSIEPMTGVHTLVCMSARGDDLRSQTGLSPLSPFGPLVIAENESRQSARMRGREIYRNMRIGQTVDIAAFIEANRPLVRAHSSPDATYSIVTIDLGGRPRPGAVFQARDVGFLGVRNGRVEWKSSEEGDRLNLGFALCRSAAQVPGRVRPGCSSTGYYFP